MSDSGHPSRFGYVQCVLCKTWRPITAVMAILGGDGSWFCREGLWCNHQQQDNAAAKRLSGFDANGSEAP